MPTIVSSYIQTLAGTVDTRTADSLTFPFTARPQAMTIYLKCQERGAVHISNGVIFRIASGGSSVLVVNRLPASAFYQLQFTNHVGVTRNSNLTSGPVVGNIFELVGQVATSGAVQLHQSIQGATVTSATASAAMVFPPSWAVNTLTVAPAAVIALLNLLIVRGVQDMATMRRLAGTGPR